MTLPSASTRIDEMGSFLCCMHGSAFGGDSGRALLELAERLEAEATTRSDRP